MKRGVSGAGLPQRSAPDAGVNVGAATAAGTDVEADVSAAGVGTPPRTRRSAVPSRWVVRGLLAALLLGLAVASLLGSDTGRAEVRTVQVQGVSLRTNLEVSAGVSAGVVYVTLPVNTALGDVVLELGDAAEDAAIRAFVSGIDTLRPAEYELLLDDVALRVLVTGMATP